MDVKFSTRRGAFCGAFVFSAALVLSLAGCGGGTEAERVNAETGGTPPIGANGKRVYQEDPASKAAGGSGMPTPPVR